MADKKASIIKRSDLPGINSYKSLREALREIAKTSAAMHEKEVAKVLKKVRR
jgi:hypothetical protein